MAAPLGVRLFHPIRIWLAINLLMLGILSSAAWGIWHLSSTETQNLADIQRDTIVRSRIDDLRHGRFRDVIEGAGSKFGDLFFEIESGRERFAFGTVPDSRRCSAIGLSDGGFTKPLTFKLCRPFVFPTSTMSAIIIFYLLSAAISFFIVARTERLAVKDLANFFENQGLPIERSGGLVSVLRRVRKLVSDLESTRLRQTELAKSEAVAQMARQVGHDIRSPLAALEMMAVHLGTIPSEERRLIQEAVGRIRDIANDLQSGAKVAPSDNAANGALPAASSSRLPVQHLGSMIDSILSEKRVEFTNRPSLKIEHGTSADDRSIFAKVDPVSFKRAMSNIINNSVEAIKGDGCIEVSAYHDARDVVVRIADNGKGIDAATLARLSVSELTSGKIGGQGLGLLQARQMAQRAGGVLRIQSQSEMGTVVFVALPRLRLGLGLRT